LKDENFIATIKKLFRKKGFGMVAIGLCAGLALMIIPQSTEDPPEASVDGRTLTSAEYCLLLEQKAEALIKELPDVDGCKVFITLEKGYGYVYATDQHFRQDGEAQEMDKNLILAEGKDGEVPLPIEETLPKVAGVAVVCDGASYETQYRIINLMCALFDIQSNRISVQT